MVSEHKLSAIAFMPYTVVIRNDLDVDCEKWFKKISFKIKKGDNDKKKLCTKRYRLKRVVLYVKEPFSVSFHVGNSELCLCQPKYIHQVLCVTTHSKIIACAV